MKTYAVVNDAPHLRTKLSKWLLHKANTEEDRGRIQTGIRKKELCMERARLLIELSKELDQIEICHEQPQIGGYATFI